MADKHEFTDAEDEIIRQRRADLWTWEAIGKEIGISQFSVVTRAKRLGCHTKPMTAGRFTATPDKLVPDDDFRWLGARPALPAGHPISWCAITDGTVLEGTEYPA